MNELKKKRVVVRKRFAEIRKELLSIETQGVDETNIAVVQRKAALGAAISGNDIAKLLKGNYEK